MYSTQRIIDNQIFTHQLIHSASFTIYNFKKKAYNILPKLYMNNARYTMYYVGENVDTLCTTLAYIIHSIMIYSVSLYSILYSNITHDTIHNLTIYCSVKNKTFIVYYTRCMIHCQIMYPQVIYRISYICSFNIINKNNCITTRYTIHYVGCIMYSTICYRIQ